MSQPDRAMVLAAGKGERMRPLTERLPKPLIPVAGRAMLDRALDHLDRAQVTRRVVNAHWLADLIEAHLEGRPGIAVSREDELLDTGGGVARALPLLGPLPFFVCNADVVWTDGARPSLPRLAEAWRDAEMDALLLLQPIGAAIGYDGAGDFEREADGRLRRRRGSSAPFVFAGVQMLHPRLFAGAPKGAFSLNLLYDKAIEAGRLFGLVHDGAWLHIGTPAALAQAETWLRAQGI